MPLCWLGRLPRADAGAQSGGCRVARRWSGAWLCGCGNRRLVTGTFAVDSRLQSDGAERYHPRPQVVYLDPMFPHKQKSALVKKEMRVFQSLVGPDLDADGLLEPARLLATKRVVVKRPDYAPPLANVATPNAVVTKGHRFDIYAGTPV